MYIVTDTHPWVWFLTASQRLSQKAKSVLSDSPNLIIIPSIVMMYKAIADSKLAPVIW